MSCKPGSCGVNQRCQRKTKKCVLNINKCQKEQKTKKNKDKKK